MILVLLPPAALPSLFRGVAGLLLLRAESGELERTGTGTDVHICVCSRSLFDWENDGPRGRMGIFSFMNDKSS